MKKEGVKRVIAWVLAVLTGLSFLVAGWPKIMPGENMIRRFENWGYSAEFAVVTGVLEIAGGLLILLPKTAVYGAALVMVLMLGAVYTHLSTGIGSPVFAFVYLATAIVVAVLRFSLAASVRKGWASLH